MREQFLQAAFNGVVVNQERFPAFFGRLDRLKPLPPSALNDA
jgi:hypothetical protein